MYKPINLPVTLRGGLRGMTNVLKFLNFYELNVFLVCCLFCLDKINLNLQESSAVSSPDGKVEMQLI